MILNNKRLSSGDQYFNVDHLKSDLKKRAVRGAGATVLSNIMSLSIQVIGTIILARLLTPDDFGLVAMVAILSLLLQNFGYNGFVEAVIQSDEINHEQISTLFWVNVGLSLGLTLIFMASSSLIVWFYGKSQLKTITIFMALSIMFAGLSNQHMALMARNMQFFRIALIGVASTSASVFIAIILAWNKFGYWALVSRRVAIPLIGAAMAWILCRWRPGLPSMGTKIMPMLKFAMNTYGNFSMNYFSKNLEKVLIGWRHGSQSLGFYNNAYHLFIMPTNQLSYSITNVSVSALSRLRDDPEKYHNFYLNAVSMLAFVGMALSAVLTLISNDLVLFLLGPKWAKTGQIFSIFGPGIGIMLIYATNGWLHLSLGRADRWFRWGIFSLIVTAFFFMVGLPFGVIGIAVAFTVSFYVLIGPGLWYAGRPIGLKFSSIGLAIWKYFISALAAGLLSWFTLYSYAITSNIFISLHIVERIFVTIILCVSIYLLLIIAFYRGIKPISQFITLFYDLVPDMHLKKTNI